MDAELAKETVDAIVEEVLECWAGYSGFHDRPSDDQLREAVSDGFLRAGKERHAEG